MPRADTGMKITGEDITNTIFRPAGFWLRCNIMKLQMSSGLDDQSDL